MWLVILKQYNLSFHINEEIAGLFKAFIALLVVSQK